MRKIGQKVYSLITELEKFKEDKEKAKAFGIDTNIFENMFIYRLGIQAPPGTKFTINYYDKSPDNLKAAEIEINQYGVYELDLKDGLGVITSLVFTQGAYPKITEATVLDDNEETLVLTDMEKHFNFYNEFFPTENTEKYTFYNKIYVDYIEEVEI